MEAGLTPRLVELVYDALLKAHWRKSALKAFVRRNGIKDSFLNSWDVVEGESKRQFLDRLFPLLERSPNGPTALNRMARSLAEMATFPDLQGWEESARMIAEAQASVEVLKDYLKDKDAERRASEERSAALAEARARRENLQREVKDLERLEQRLAELQSRIGTPEAGYEFETWFFDLMDYSEIKNRRPFRASGRQIDGSITIGDTTYLTELKFENHSASAPDIDTFYRKVSSKADNTMGIFLAISGYSKVAIDAASGERSPILLLDHTHVYAVLGRAMVFRTIVERVRRHASQTAEAYLAVSEFGAA